jgi:hypothetical protein
MGADDHVGEAVPGRYSLADEMGGALVPSLRAQLIARFAPAAAQIRARTHDIRSDSTCKSGRELGNENLDLQLDNPAQMGGIPGPKDNWQVETRCTELRCIRV